jgi:hypothetical protein
MDSNKQDRQLAALLTSIAITGFAVIYWVIQIQGVRDMLAMAYG